MYKIQTIDEYDPLGNSLEVINNNFSIIDTRLCEYDKNRPIFDALFSSIRSLSGELSNFSTTIQENSSLLSDSANLVYNLKDYWLNPVTLMYPKTFSVLANYQEIENWLNETFPNYAPSQMFKVQFVVKSFDHLSLDGTALETFSTDTLDALSSPYNIKTVDIKRYIILDNHVKSVISSINNIFKRLDIKIPVNSYTDLDYIASTFTVHRQVLSSSKIDLSQDNLLVIWSFLAQYQLLRDEYLSLYTLGISTIPSNILLKFNVKNIVETFIGDFCFVFSDDAWRYVPSCSRDICANQYCDDCYDVLDVNGLYTGTDCPLKAKYVLIECDSAVIPNTTHVFTESQTFTIPTGASKMYVKCWGSKADDENAIIGSDIAYGGGGGYTYAEFDIIENTQYNILVNTFGGIGSSGIVNSGGGLAGVFSGPTNVTKNSYNRALIIAGGGGGPVSDVNTLTNGNPGNDVTSGTMTNMQGEAGYGSAPISIDETASGGGGYRGGSAGNGGSGYVSSAGSNSSIIAGSGSSTANTSDDDYALLNGNNGGVIIEIEYDINFILD